MIHSRMLRHAGRRAAAVLAGVCALCAVQAVTASALLPAPPSPSAETPCPPSRPVRVVPVTDGGVASSDLPRTPICRSSVQSESLITNNSDVVWALHDHVAEGAGSGTDAGIFRTYTVPLITMSPDTQFLVPGESVLVEHEWGGAVSLDVHAQLTALWRAQQTVSNRAEYVLDAPLPYATAIKVKSAVAACAVATMDGARGIAEADVGGGFWAAAIEAAASATACKRVWNEARQTVDLPALHDFRGAAR